MGALAKWVKKALKAFMIFFAESQSVTKNLGKNFIFFGSVTYGSVRSFNSLNLHILTRAARERCVCINCATEFLKLRSVTLNPK